MDVKVEIIPATIDDASELSFNIREADRVEIWRTSMIEPLVAAELAISMSDKSWSARCNGDLICIFGVGTTSIVTATGSPWMLSTDNIIKYPLHFLSQCRFYIEEMSCGFDVLINHVDADNVDAINWLKWLGFKFKDEPEPYGVLGHPFYEFEMRK